MKLAYSDWNNVLQDVKQITQSVDPLDADALVLFNDVRGTYKDAAQTAKQLGKKVYVVQHGRAATRDYGPPNNFPLIADKFLAWGVADKERMDSLGYGDRTEIVGCPLLKYIQPKREHEGKYILFVPVNTDHEQPENLAVYYSLQALKYGRAAEKLLADKARWKKEWETDPTLLPAYHKLSDIYLLGKLLPRHIKGLYHGETFVTNPDDPRHMKLLFDLLSSVDCVVTLDEGTTEILALAADVPVVCCDVFKYDKLGGQKYEIESLRTPGIAHCSIEDLHATVLDALNNPDKLKKERAETVERELGVSYGRADHNILKAIGW